MRIINELNTKTKCILGTIAAKLVVDKSSPSLLATLNSEAESVKNQLSLETLHDFKPVFDARSAYRVLDRNPNRYPVSSEALFKRILQGKSLYFVNNVVDVNNLISLRSGYSVGSYNSESIFGNITFRQGRTGERYKGIGKSEFELENLPLLADNIGPFGSPTSDSERAMITSATTNVIMVIYGFAAMDLTTWLNQASELLEQYAKATDIEMVTL